MKWSYGFICTAPVVALVIAWPAKGVQPQELIEVACSDFNQARTVGARATNNLATLDDVLANLDACAVVEDPPAGFAVVGRYTVRGKEVTLQATDGDEPLYVFDFEAPRRVFIGPRLRPLDTGSPDYRQ